MPLVTNEMNIQSAFNKAGITELLPRDFNPQVMVQVQYPGSGDEVAMGNTLEIGKTQEVPRVMFIPTDDNTQYTLLLVDPDAPSKSDPKFGPYRHWVVGNIPGSTGLVETNTANELTPYMGPAPPPGSGPHRYIFLLYRQTREQHSFTPLNVQDRSKFSFSNFAQENQLELIGANFFYAERKE
ncbi:phosphatidylethanolamine-binding protein [Syncephalastrum racemosum]|uniref:Phosphatidylethanolamine-binding protein n=1 Tax=Syncephalastrum racemosum TaxID=13706 RepID=A0A1X2HAE3_SYNRA|nr:phosphatidylethanolamine-binding protein [Syncephalastrum racemosum]